SRDSPHNGFPGIEHLSPIKDTGCRFGHTELISAICILHSSICNYHSAGYKTMSNTEKPLVGIIMGSKSDWEVMRAAAETLNKFGVAQECEVMSAHRTPDLVTKYVSGAEGAGLEVLIAAAGGAAHLAGVTAAHTLLPVLGVPMESASLKGLDSLLSTVQMP